jgi:hypothetical protein
MWIAAHQMLDTNLISPPETLAIGLAIMMRNRGMPEFIAVFDTRLTMVFIILARAFNAIVKALRLYSLNLGRWSSPHFVAVIWWRRRRPLLGVLRIS